MKIASIDIGTNTCNLVIADYAKGSGLRFLHRDKKPITLINKEFVGNNISAGSVSHLINVLNDYKTTMKAHNVDKIVAIATSGVRSSANRDFLINSVQTESGIKIKVINGNKEAELAWMGVKNAISFDEKPVLIIDIGGGSIEFIICNNSGILWIKSFDIGVARMMISYDFSDPLTIKDIKTVYAIMDKELKVLLQKASVFKVATLIGSSGSFETFAALTKFECDGIIKDETQSNEIDLGGFIQVYKKLVRFDEKQRTDMPGMEFIRVKMIPIAAVIVKYLIEKLQINSFIQSNYSIKEGTLFDYVEKKEKQNNE